MNKKLVFLLVALLIPVLAKSQSPQSEISGPYLVAPSKVLHLYSGLTNTFYATVSKYSGDYRLDFYIGDEHTDFSVNEPSLHVIPVLGRDEGKMGALTISTRNSDQDSFVVIRRESYKVEFPPLFAVPDEDAEVGDALFVKAWLGIEGIQLIPLPKGLRLMPVPGYFEGGIDTIKERESNNFFGGDEIDRFDFEFHPLPSQAKVPKDGKDVNVTAIDPFTGQNQSFTVHIMPRRGSVVDSDDSKN